MSFPVRLAANEDSNDRNTQSKPKEITSRRPDEQMLKFARQGNSHSLFEASA